MVNILSIEKSQKQYRIRSNRDRLDIYLQQKAVGDMYNLS